MTDQVKIAVLGADGRMGRAVIGQIMSHAGAVLVAAFTSKTSKDIGADAGRIAGMDAVGITLTHDIKAGLALADVVIDFSAPHVTIDTALMMFNTPCRVLVTGTTGYTAQEEAALLDAASGITLLKSGNFSLGVNVLDALVEMAASRLKVGWDIEVLDMHHRHKVDAPSGTALLLGDAAARGRDVNLSDVRVPARDGRSAPRRDGDIGFAALRGGGVIGEHTVSISSELEQIRLSHSAFDRSVFASGALVAALWAADKPKGQYDMKDVLDLNP